MFGDSKIDVNDLHVFVTGKQICLRQVIAAGGSSATFEVRLSPKDALRVATQMRHDAVRLRGEAATEAAEARTKRPVL